MSRAIDATATPASGHGEGRQSWIEVAKGLGIIVVVWYHVVGSFRSYGAPKGLLQVNTYWDVRLRNSLPIFFFISGLLAVRTVRRPARSFWTYLVQRLLYPYVVWSVLSVALSAYIAGSNANRRLQVDDLLLIAWRPVLQYWFLLALVCYLLVSRLVIRLDPTLRVFLPLLAVTWVAVLLRVGVDGYFSRMLELHFGFFCLGLLAGRHVVGVVSRRSTRALVGLVLGGLAVTALVVRPRAPWPQWPLLPAIAGLVPLVVLLALSVAVARHFPGSPLEYLGSHSLEIYVAHVIAAAAVRTALFHIGVRSLPLHLTAGLIVATLGPLALDAAVSANRLPNPFRLSLDRARLRQRPAGTSPA